MIFAVILVALMANQALQAVDNAPVPTWVTQSWQSQ